MEFNKVQFKSIWAIGNKLKYDHYLFSQLVGNFGVFSNGAYQLNSLNVYGNIMKCKAQL